MKEHAENIGKSIKEFGGLVENMNQIINKLPANQRKLFTNFWNDSMKDINNNKGIIDILETNANFIKSVENIKNDNNAGSKS